MRIALTAGLVALLVLSSAVPAGTAAPARSAGPARSAPREAQPEGPGSSRAPAADLLALLDQYHEWSLQQNPTEASRRGDKRFGALLRDESPEAYAAREQFVRALRAELDAIDPTALADEDRLNADLLAYELDSFLADRPFHQEQIQLSSRSGPQIWLPQLADTLVFTTERDYADYAARLEAIGPYIDQVIAQMRLGLAAGRVPPRVTLAGVVEQTRALAAAGVARAPESSPFYEPFAAHPPDDPLAGRARAAIAGVVVPAFSRLADFLETEYVPRARESVGASEGIDGLDFYRAQLREHTTLDLSPDQVHEIGLAEVARLRAEMLETIARTDFAARESLRGDALLAAFLEYLRTDPRFYHATEADLLLGYRDIAKLIDAQLPRLFGTLPRTPYGVRAMPALAAKYSPTAYYYPGSLRAGLAGYFVANTYRLDQRPRYEMIALTLHEAVPGHHLQIALAQELEEAGVHPFRTRLGYSAFVEGWALYAERLGLEMRAEEDDASGASSPAGGTGPARGLFADPYDDFGRLTYEMWRACRLVVDTGIHAKGWSRQRAIDFMLANSALSPLNIEREVDRYIAWPGQACAYKIGELRIRRLREQAEQALGARFDIRAFHDMVLGAGALPLPVLEARAQRWIDAHP